LICGCLILIRQHSFPSAGDCRRQPWSGRLVLSARVSANAGVVLQRGRCCAKAKSLKINKRCNAGVARNGLQNRGLQVRFLPGLFL
jgi:hypothetical protein